LLLYTIYRFYRDDDTKWLDHIEAKFKEFAGEDGIIDKDEFKQALGVKRVCI